MLVVAMRLPAAERREQLLRTAVAVFAEHGYHATSMNDVAEAAGVTKPVLYQHFSSKRELFIELLADIGVVGAQATSITAFLRKATQYGGRVAETTEEHISFSIPTALITPDPASGSHGGESTFKWNLDIPWNGTDSILTMDTTAAISAE